MKIKMGKEEIETYHAGSLNHRVQRYNFISMTDICMPSFKSFHHYHDYFEIYIDKVCVDFGLK